MTFLKVIATSSLCSTRLSHSLHVLFSKDLFFCEVPMKANRLFHDINAGLDLKPSMMSSAMSTTLPTDTNPAEFAEPAHVNLLSTPCR